LFTVLDAKIPFPPMSGHGREWGDKAVFLMMYKNYPKTKMPELMLFEKLYRIQVGVLR